jgi:glycosyltransferase involved in cell wall biosynthesis
MRLAYVTTYPLADRRQFSGLGHAIAQALARQDIALDVIDSLAEPLAPWFKVKQAVYRAFGRRHLREREPFVLRAHARQIARRLNGNQCDVVFSPGTLPLAALECEPPIAFWADATFAGMRDFYPEFSRLSDASLRHGHQAEQAALTRCRLALYASDWAARSALAHYQVDPAKVHVVPFGANLQLQPAEDDVRAAIDARPRDVCRLLFLGVDWARKGGDAAVAVAAALNRRGLRAELTVAGCLPPAPLPPFVRALGFVRNTSPAEAARFNRLLAESHFLILPSRAECFGLVFCEASAFGVPSLATNVGGIPSAVRDGVNGQTFAPDAPAEAYADFIETLWRAPTRYRDLASSAFHEYQTRLNWDVAGRSAKQLIQEYLP